MSRFKIGQKVVCVKNHSMKAVIKGKIYNILGYDDCGCNGVDIGLTDPSVVAHIKLYRCYSCNKYSTNTSWFISESLFAPIQEDGSTAELNLCIEEFELETIELN